MSEYPSNATAVQRFRLRSKRPVLRLKRLDRLDRRTRSYRYANELIACWTKALTADGSELTEVQHRAIRYAAACAVLAENALAKLMAGDTTIPVVEVTRLANSAARSVAMLHLPTAPKPPDPKDWNIR